MNDKTKTLIVLAAVVLAAVVGVVIYRSGKNSSGKGYQGQGGDGFWGSLFNNGANIVDASGRLLSSFTTSIGNAVVATRTSKTSGQANYASYGYADEKDFGPYVIAGSVILATIIAVAIISKT